MEIRNLRRQAGAGRLVALFDLELSPEVIINDWQLRDTPKGLRSYPPSPRTGRPCVFLAPALFSQIGHLATSAYQGGNAQYDANRTA